MHGVPDPCGMAGLDQVAGISAEQGKSDGHSRNRDGDDLAAKPRLGTVWPQSVLSGESANAVERSWTGWGAAPPKPRVKPSPRGERGARAFSPQPARVLPAQAGMPWGLGGAAVSLGPSPRQARPRAGDARGACPAPNAPSVGNPV